MAQHEAVARPYAQAVFELGQESGQLDQWSALLATAAALVEDPALRPLVDAPGTDRDRLAELLASTCEQDADASLVASSQEGRNFFRLLAENRRLAALPAIAAAFEARKAALENRVNVVLTAAVPVDEAQQSRMADALKRRFGRDVRLRFVLDENLIGGARLKADDHVIDGSVRTRLAKLASALVH